jgi:hypothetical protein
MLVSHEALVNRLGDFVNRWLVARMRSLDPDMSPEEFMLEDDVPGRIWSRRVYVGDRYLTLTHLVVTSPSAGVVHYYNQMTKVGVNTRPVADVQEYLEYALMNMVTRTHGSSYAITWVTVATPSGDRHGIVGTIHPLFAADFAFRRLACG